MYFESRRTQLDQIAYESYASNSAAHRLCTKMCVIFCVRLRRTQKITQENLHNQHTNLYL